MSMFRGVFTSVAFLCLISLAAFSRDVAQLPAPAAPSWLDEHRATATRLIHEAQADQFAWHRLAELTDTFGNRLSGSDNLARAIGWAVEAMNKDGLENVHTERVMVPRWVRGRESLELLEPPHHAIPMLGLGSSVATPPAGLEADLIVVKSFEELNQRSADVKGKVVLYNAAYVSYGQTNVYRTSGASRAAQHGAVASLVRSIGPMGLRTPLTGNMTYAEGAPRIPAAAISAEDAERLQRLADRGVAIRVRLRMEAHFEPDVESFNVVGEVRGSDMADDIVLVGAGASDDGVGCIVTWEAARLMKKLGIRPRRTVRVVLFTNEENGTRGGIGYRDAHLQEAERHVLAIESDSGVFSPARLGFSGSDAATRMMHRIASLLTPLGFGEIGTGGGGADIGPIATAGKVPMLAYQGDSSRYFTIHHTPADTIDRIAPEDVSRAAAALAVVTYVVADARERLPR
jgi:carboxypeptidase Q